MKRREDVMLGREGSCMASATEESKVHQMVGRGGTGPAGWRHSLVPRKSGHWWGPEQDRG